ncbi:tetratricopeptide repeat protein [bacterium]|nr:tetratricopeptide repeat protein [bacterium]
MKHRQLVKTVLACIVLFTALPSASLADLNAEHYYKAAERALAEAEMVEGKDLARELKIRAGDAFLRSAELGSGQLSEEALVRAAESYVAADDRESHGKALMATLMVAENFPKGTKAPAALLLQGDIFAAEKEWGRSIRSWMAIPAAHASSSEAPQALYRAGGVFSDRIKNMQEARAAYSQCVEKYPQSDIADDSLLARARLSEKEDDYESAIADYLNLADTYTAGELADRALYDAISLYERKLKDYPKVYELSVRFREQFPHSEFLDKVQKLEDKTLRYVQ